MRSAELSIREEFRLIDKKNPVSGHQWTEHGPTTSWVVVGPTGVLSRCRSQEGAEKQLQEWKDYFDRGGFEEHPAWDYKNDRPVKS